MRVGIDYRPALVDPHGTGRYARELVRGMVELAFDGNLGLFGYTLERARFSRAELGLAGGRAELVRLRLPERLLTALMGRLGRGADDLVGGCELFHHTALRAERRGRLPVREAAEVTTLLDCSFAYPESGYRPEPEAERLFERAREAVTASARVLVPSHFVGAEAVMTLGAHPDRVTVVELGCDHVARHLPAELPPPPATPYVLTVGRVDARKNHLRMLAAFEALATEGLPHRWVIVGEPGHGSGPFERALAESPVRGRVEWRRRVPEADLPLLYARTDCFLFASLNEGFGLPALEALACGAPVVTSCVSALPEVCGDAAFLVEPTEPERIFEACRRVLTEPEIAAELRLRARLRARKLTWREAAKRTLLAYRNALERSGEAPRLRHTL